MQHPLGTSTSMLYLSRCMCIAANVLPSTPMVAHPSELKLVTRQCGGCQRSEAGLGRQQHVCCLPLAGCCGLSMGRLPFLFRHRDYAVTSVGTGFPGVFAVLHTLETRKEPSLHGPLWVLAARSGVNQR